jgi:hypothetical protein
MAESMNERSLLKTGLTALATSLAGAFLAFLLASKGMEVEVATNARDLQDLTNRLRVAETAVAILNARADGIDKKIDDIWQVVVNGRPGFRNR